MAIKAHLNQANSSKVQQINLEKQSELNVYFTYNLWSTKFNYKIGWTLRYNLIQYIFIGDKFWQIHFWITSSFYILHMLAKFLEN